MQKLVMRNPFNHKGEWIEDPQEAETLRNFIEEFFHIEIPKNYCQIGISRKGKIKYTIKGTSELGTLTKEVTEKAKRKYMQCKLGTLKESTKNYFNFIESKHDFIESTIRNILFNKTTIHIKWETYSAKIYDGNNESKNTVIYFAAQDIVEQNEEKNEHEIKEWLSDFLERNLQDFHDELKKEILQDAKIKTIQVKAIDAIPELQREISAQYNCNAQVSSKRKKQTLTITLTIKPSNTNLTFKKSKTFSKEELSELEPYITITASEECTSYSYQLDENFNKILCEFIKREILQGTIYINVYESPQNELPEKLKKRYEKYEKAEDSIPTWYIKKASPHFKAMLSLEDSTITYYTKYFQASGTKQKEFQETRYGEKITEFQKNTVLKEALKFIKKLDLQFSKKNLLISSNNKKEYGEVSSKLNITSHNINNIYTTQISLTDNIENWKQSLQTNIDNIFNKITQEQKEIEENTVHYTKDLLNIAVAKTIYNNDGWGITGIISNLRGVNTTQYREMNKSEFTKILNLIPASEIENAIDYLVENEVITAKNKEGTYQWYTAYYSNPLTRALIKYYDKNKKQIFKYNNIVLEKHIQTIKKKKRSELTIKDYMPLIDENNKIIDYAMNLEALKEVFRYAPDDFIKLMSMKKKIINDPVRIKVYNTLIKVQKDYKKLLKEIAKNPERLELQEKQ